MLERKPLPRDEWVPTGRHCQPKHREDCVFFDNYDWLSEEYIYCVKHEKPVGVDRIAWRAARCPECLAENPEPAAEPNPADIPC